MAAALDRTTSASPIGKMTRLRKGRKGKDSNVSSPSLGGSSSGDPDEGVAASRTSLESAIDRLKPSSRRSSEDKRSITESRRLSKLIPSKIKNRRRSGDDGGPRGTLLSSDDAIARGGHISQNESSTSLANSGSIHSSLMTEDSEHEG
ncbi:hypothetical protein K461DRAFT_281505 [Myriangium duriaei CBS 260.36]|uniref:Uncharacterized protein n=1 Tax=Myriangium duriaei CBS 260.36 TaxID=1168546 RepID=A0A9P4IYY7_9PEZI|nr:hypothetical protein K461DRAFT_281505 [Myriangium duriaei CBS 260.36]